MLKLIKSHNPILKKRLLDFDFLNPIMNSKDLEEQMIQLMIESNGRGLAANQVGVEARVFIMKTELLHGVHTPFALFNPILLAKDDELVEDYEGCLSFPNLFLAIKRSKNVVAQFLDRDNKEYIIEFKDIDARCFLHELDHLNGICFTDGISQLKLELAKKKQRKLNGRTKQPTTASV
jgi:peptide deformylase